MDQPKDLPKKMPPRKTSRFVDLKAAPVAGTSEGKKLKAVEKKYTLDQAFAFFRDERKKSASLQNACNMADALLKSGLVGSNSGNLISLKHDSRVAIVAFTFEEPFNVCYDFNEKSRNLTLLTWNNFPYKGMWLLLNKAILSLGEQSSSRTFYRGIVEKVKGLHPGMDYCFCQVASSSLIREKAEEFTRGIGTLFIIKGPKCLSIEAISAIDDEFEYIIPAFDTFKVTQVDDTGKYRIIYLQA